MKSKKEFILLGIVIAALAAYLFFHKTDRTHYQLPDMPKLSDSDISYIKITKGAETVELKQKDDNWRIYPEKYPADKNKIDSMVDVVKNLTVTAMVSEGESYQRYKLDPENKITVQAGTDDSNILRTFDIGKAAPSNRHTFIKLPDDKRVYHARNSFRSKFDRTRDDLRDKTVLKVDRNQVQQVEITDKDGKSILKMAQAPVKADDTAADTNEEAAQEEEKTEETATSSGNAPPKLVWQDAEGNPVKESDINNLFNNVSNLKCQSYIDGKTKDDFTEPLYTITMTGPGKTYTLSIFEKLNEDDDAYPAISSENDYPFMLPAYKMNNMVKQKAKDS